jgi:hypothetical protein
LTRNSGTERSKPEVGVAHGNEAGIRLCLVVAL